MLRQYVDIPSNIQLNRNLSFFYDSRLPLLGLKYSQRKIIVAPVNKFPSAHFRIYIHPFITAPFNILVYFFLHTVF
jgi:hypothetical protein